MLHSITRSFLRNSCIDASIISEVAHLCRNSLLVCLHGIIGNGGAITTVAAVVECRLQTPSAGFHGHPLADETTYRVACVPIAGDVALSTTKVNTSVLLSIAPALPEAGGDTADRN